ncbi:major capsid protein E [Vibrio parahaemolyticus]|nr:major capsid protein E [Vibrio parahaemolyticus]MBE4527490.1 major capsid protein E [Vibrio parahaemolyticus]
MNVIDLFRSWTKPNVWNAYLKAYKKRKPVKMPIRNDIFGPAIPWNDVALPYSELKDTLTNVPVVRRGSASLAVKSEDSTIKSIEVQGFILSHFVSAATLGNLKALGSVSAKQYFDLQNNNMLRRVEKGIEAMCAQALTGKVEYPMKLEDGTFETFEIDYGETETYEATGKVDLSSADTKLSDVFSLLQSMEEKIEERGYGGDTLTYAGKVAFGYIMDIASSNNTRNIPVQIKESEIVIGGYVVKRMSGKYKTWIGGAVDNQAKIPEGSLCMVDKEAGHSFYYLAIDDLDAGLQALPFFTKPIPSNDPSGAKLIAHSKPVPAPVVGAICWCADAIAA